MTRLFAILFLVAAVLLPQPVLAVDKGDLKRVNNDQLQTLLDTFTTVPVYYVLTADGDSIVRVYKKNEPGLTAPIRYAVTLYLDPKAAEQYRQELEKSTKKKHLIKSAEWSTILKAQHAARNKPAAKTLKEMPNFVVFKDRKHKPIRVVYLVDESSEKPFTIKVDKSRQEIVPVFVYGKKAQAAQKKFEQISKRKLRRVNEDFGTFIRTQRSFNKKKLVALGFSYDRPAGIKRTVAQGKGPDSTPLAGSPTGPFQKETDQPSPPEEEKKPAKRVTFDGQTFDLAFAKSDSVVTTEEYLPAGQNLQAWTQMASIRVFHQQDDPKQAVDGLAKLLARQSPPPPQNITTDSDSGAVMIDFVMFAPDKSFVEFNIFKYSKRAEGGLLAEQYAIREYKDTLNFLVDLKPLRDRLVQFMSAEGLKLVEGEESEE